MNREEYYTAPSIEIFDQIKSASMKLWLELSRYEKVERIKDIQNVSDNTCYLVAMFDESNRMKLYDSLNNPVTKEGTEAKVWLHDLLFNNQT